MLRARENAERSGIASSMPSWMIKECDIYRSWPKPRRTRRLTSVLKNGSAWSPWQKNWLDSERSPLDSVTKAAFNFTLPTPSKPRDPR